ncbi:hypothetical protein C6P45_003871 [Maudiozyma exigua]|uniref:CST complex subunit Stn1 N-terminal domain-containing protein n=1 Tax=Maudiozyma exigua TaxID=34358 RepID=A0A9P7BBK2_MAUEX|nr:hypothetical protein C6P45_003871 [Kazachstania exigua]
MTNNETDNKNLIYTSPENHLNYYSKKLFKFNSFYNDPLGFPILLSSLLQLCEHQKRSILFSKLYPFDFKRILFIKNNPLESFHIKGKIISYKMKYLNGKDQIIICLDDISNFRLRSIQFKCPLQLLEHFNELGLDLFDQHCIIEYYRITKNNTLGNLIPFWQKCIIAENKINESVWNPDTIIIEDDNVDDEIHEPLLTNDDIACEETPTIYIIDDSQDMSLIDEQSIHLSLDHIHNMKQAYTTFVLSLIEHTSRRSSILNIDDLYEAPDIKNLLNHCIKNRYSQGYRLNELLSFFLNKLYEQNLILWNKENQTIDALMLRNIYKYLLKRIHAMLLIESLTITLDKEFIFNRLKLSTEEISMLTIINLTKIVLTNMSHGENRSIDSWWIEEKTNSFWIIHLLYT